MSLRLARRWLVATVASMGVIAPSTARADLPPDYLPPNPGPVAAVEGVSWTYGCFPLPGLFLGPEAQINIHSDAEEQGLTTVGEPPIMNGSPDGAVCMGIKEKGFVGIVTFLVTLSSSRGASYTYELVLYVGVPLPATGVSTWVQAGWAASLFLAGLVLMVLGRRRPRMVA